MCVIITADTGSMPTISQLAAMSDTNPDGAGIAWHDGTRLHRYRDPDNMKTLAHIIHNHHYLRTVPFLLHFRLATHGAKTEANTHPFHYQRDNQHGYIAHNGIALDYTHGPHANDSRNIIAAWQHHQADLTTGTHGAFASIDHTGHLQWQHGGDTIPGDTGTIIVSNHHWNTTRLDPDSLKKAYDTGYDDALYDLQGIPDHQPHH